QLHVLGDTHSRMHGPPRDCGKSSGSEHLSPVCTACLVYRVHQTCYDLSISHRVGDVSPHHTCSERAASAGPSRRFCREIALSVGHIRDRSNFVSPIIAVLRKDSGRQQRKLLMVQNSSSYIRVDHLLVPYYVFDCFPMSFAGSSQSLHYGEKQVI